MIQFNLLPDVKLEYVKAKRAKRTITLIAMIVGGAAFGLFLMLFVTVNVFQKRHMSNLTNDITAQRAELDAIKDLDKILTVQNQLNSLSDLHEQKPVTTRLFEYLPQLVPQEVSIADLTLNYADSTMTIVGSTDSLGTVNKFVDTLKFTQYRIEGQEPASAFSNVVLADFSRSPVETSFSVELSFDPAIFDLAQTPELTIPNIISTRSETEKPSEDLFRELINPEGVNQ